MNHTKYDTQAQQGETMFHEWDDNQEDHVVEQFNEMWDGLFKVFVSAIALTGFASVMYFVIVDGLNYYL